MEIKLLFICTHNRCRSILAEAIANHIGGDAIQAASAGSSPQGQVHPLSLKYLAEHGVRTDGLCSQSWDEFEHFSPDAVLTLCDSAAQETCPVWFGKLVQVHWGLSDPSAIDTMGDDSERESFNKTINILERRIRALLDSDVNVSDREALRATLSQIAVNIN